MNIADKGAKQKIILREVWSKSSVFQDAHLTKEEFNISMKYVSLAQSGYSVSFESLKANHFKVELPKFQGIPIPPAPALDTKRTNPFDDLLDQEDNEDDFEGFQEAKSGHEGTTSSSSYKINNNPTLESNLMQIQMQQPAPTLFQMQNIQYPMQMNLNLGQMGQFQQQQADFTGNQQNQAQVLESEPSQLSSRSEKKEEPTNYDDLIFQKMKKIPKMAPKPEPPKIEQTQDSWANFQSSSIPDPNQHKNRYDLINEAFEELVSGNNNDQKQEERRKEETKDQDNNLLSIDPLPSRTLQTQNSQPQVNLLDLDLLQSSTLNIQKQPTEHTQPINSNSNVGDEDEDDDFGDFNEAPSSTKHSQQEEHKINVEDILGAYTQSQRELDSEPKKIPPPSSLSSQKSFPSVEIQPKPSETVDIKIENEEEDDGFEDYVEAAPSIPTIGEEQKQEEQVIQASKSQFQADFGFFNNQGSDNNEEQKMDYLNQGWANQVNANPQIISGRSISSEVVSDQNQIRLQTQDDMEDNNEEGDDFGDFTEAQPNEPSTINEPYRESLVLEEANTNREVKEDRPSLIFANDMSIVDKDKGSRKQSETKLEQNKDLLMMDDDDFKADDPNEETIQQVQPKRPRVELDENNLLSGFMQEFGLNVFQQAQSQAMASSEAQEDAFMTETKRKESHQVEFEGQSSEELLEQLNQRINQHFGSPASPSKGGYDFQNLSKEDYEKEIQQNKQKLNSLAEYLKSVVELPENDIKDSVQMQIQLLEKIEKKNKKKALAAADEDFEKAAKLKKQVVQLQSQFLSFDKVQDLISRKPILSLKELIQRIDIGMLNIKKRLEEIIFTISNEIKTMNEVYESISSLEQEEMELLLEEEKFKKFLKGMGVLSTMVELYQQGLIVAEAQEDFEYSMDIEALLQEVNQAQEQIQQTTSQFLSLNDNFSQYLLVKNVNLNNAQQLDQALQIIKDHQHDVSDISELCCSQCSNSFFLSEFSETIQYNGQKYHPFCINFWLNKVSKQQ